MSGDQKHAVFYVDSSPDNACIFLSNQHSITMYGRSEVPKIEIKQDAEGLTVTVDDHAVIHARCGVGVVKNQPA